MKFVEVYTYQKQVTNLWRANTPIIQRRNIGVLTGVQLMLHKIRVNDDTYVCIIA